MNDQPHDGEIDDQVSLITHQIIRKERIPTVVKSRNGIIDGMIKGCSQRKILGKPDEQERGSQGFGDEGKPENRFGDDDEISSRRMEKGRLNNLPSLEGNSPSHQDEEDRGEGDDSQSSDLKEEDGDHLPQRTQILSDVDDHQARHTDGRSGGKEGIDKTEISLGG